MKTKKAKYMDWKGDIVSNRWSILIGRPRLTLIGYECGNISCMKKDQFKKYKDDIYICKCGYIISGKFEVEKHKVKLYCGTKACPDSKSKMDSTCLKCPWIRER